MKIINIALAVTASLFLAGPVLAQQDERAALEAKEKQEIRMKMMEAEKRLAEAARQIAELSSKNLPHLEKRFEAVIGGDPRPRIGVNVSGDPDSGPVEGVNVDGVTPGSAAAEAGLRAGDILTLINDESLSSESSAKATEKLVNFMDGVEEGDKLTVEYLRDGKVGRVDIEPKVSEVEAFFWRGPEGLGDGTFAFGPDVEMHVAPDVRKRFEFAFPGWIGNAWGNMEMVELNEGLGRYFGTDSGLLVISAPASNELELQEGDVIKSIDGREPKSVGHAMRILGSYEPGEQVELRIMRDKKRATLKVEMPDKRSSGLLPGKAPVAPLHPARLAPSSRADAVIAPEIVEAAIIDTRT